MDPWFTTTETGHQCNQELVCSKILLSAYKSKHVVECLYLSNIYNIFVL